ncbi:MAG: DinB family protein [Bacteroidota bacterium]
MDKSVEKKLDKLDADLRNLLTDLDGYSEQTLNRKPDEKSWSVFQIMTHLILAEGGSIKYIQKKLSFSPELKTAGATAKARSVLVNAYLSSPLKRKAPEAIAGDNLPKYTTFWDVAKKWKNQREELRTYLDELPADLFDKELYKHPFAGKMTLGEMLAFFQKHYNRHKKQIYRTLRKLDAVKIK